MRKRKFCFASFAMTAAVGFGSASAQGIKVPEPGPHAIPPGSVNGLRAIESLGDRLASVAQEYDMQPHELATLLRSDLSAYVTPAGQVFYVCP